MTDHECDVAAVLTAELGPPAARFGSMVRLGPDRANTVGWSLLIQGGEARAIRLVEGTLGGTRPVVINSWDLAEPDSLGYVLCWAREAMRGG